MLSNSSIANEYVWKPNQNERDGGKGIKVDHQECKGDNSKADCMEEKGEVASNQIHISPGRLKVSELANVHIENVDLDGTAHDVDDREADRPHGDTEHWNLVIKPVCDTMNIDQCRSPRNVKDTFHDEPGSHDQLEGGLNAACDAVCYPGKQL